MQEQTKKSKFSKILIAAAVLILVLGIATATYYILYYNGGQSISAITSPNSINENSIRRGAKTQMDTTSQNILLIGDSMAYSLMFRTQNYCNYNGHKLNVVSWVSATSKTYAYCDTLEYFVNKFKPTYIIFVIGANELFAYNAPSRDQYFDMIMPQTHGIPIVWIGPPNWKEDTGINDVMMKRFGNRQFFLSKDLPFTRMKGDVAHPDRKSGTMWMDSIADWIMNKSYFPIRMQRPDTTNPIHVDFIKLVLGKNDVK